LKSGSTDKGRYLIITPSRFQNDLTYFANYKRNIGYTVDIVNTNTTGTSSSSIISYLHTRYNNSATRPDYVLLVGDVNDIPASDGIQGDKDNPLTDLNYARLDGDDMFADVFLGRISVSDVSELKNVLNKTISMERSFSGQTKKAMVIAGWGDGENTFYRNADKIVSKGLSGYEKDFFSNKAGDTNSDICNAVVQNDYQLIVYRGHGSSQSIYPTSSGMGSSISSLNNTSFPVFFAIACNAGNFGYSYPCFGETWIRSTHGGVAFFGGTSSTGRHSNNRILRKLFLDTYTDREQLGQITNLGMKHYYRNVSSFFSAGIDSRKKQIKRYNLLGDPSIFVRGIGCINNFEFSNNEIFYSGDKIKYLALNAIQTNKNGAAFQVKAGSEVELAAGNSVSLLPGFIAEAGSHFSASIEECNANTLKSLKLNKKELYYNSLPDDSIMMRRRNYEGVSVFPNPTSSGVTIKYNVETLQGTAILTLLDSSGQLIKRATMDIIQSGTYLYNFDLSGFPCGLYLYNLVVNGKIFSGKIIKQ
jgi:hypothetical protein